MCRGKVEKQEEEQKVVSKDATEQELVEFCELCGSEAQLYCQADDAFLCRKCDEWVHGANFLAQRHIRCLFCSSCRRLTQRYLIGNSLEVVLPSIVSNGPKNQCNSDSSAKGGCSEEVIKMPFLFL